MKHLILLLSLFCTVAVADSTLSIDKEFFRRDAIKLTVDQGDAINLLRALKFPLEEIKQLETTADGAFLLKTRHDLVCYGRVADQFIRCRNGLGIVGLEINGEFLPTVVAPSGASALYHEFANRDSVTFGEQAQEVFAFIRSLKYPIENVVEIEILGDLSKSFFIRDFNDIVCFGSVTDQMLRCKNDIGITGVNFTGDSD